MPSRVFVSHDHRDHELAQVISQTLNRITLGQLTVWYSSDGSPSGGIQPGRIWLDEIRSQLHQCKAIIALLTPNCLSRSAWLLFECGFAVGNPTCEIVPLCVGINTLSDVPAPLAMYQCYQLVNYESLKNVVGKLLARYEIVFDEELAKPVLQRAIADFARLTPTMPATKPTEQQKCAEKDDLIKDHIDRRFREIAERLDGLSVAKGESPSEPITYSVRIHLRFPKLEKSHFLEIEPSTSVQDVLDNIFYMIRGLVPSYTYLEKWILVERNTGMKMVVREVQHLVPAKHVFFANSE